MSSVCVDMEFLRQGMRKDYTICYEQCRALGLYYPPPKKWVSKILGKKISQEKANRYLAFKDKEIPKPRNEKGRLVKSRPSNSRFKYRPFVEMTLTEDGKYVIITEEWLRSGICPELGISSEQARCLGVNKRRGKWFFGIIGAQIPVKVAKRFIELKLQPREKADRKTSDRLRNCYTRQFIKEYLLTPYRKIDIRPEFQIIKLREYALKYNSEDVIRYIKRMPYKKFLTTPYWKIISAFQKYYFDYKCVMCGSKLSLNVHHTTYENHGEEAFHLEDLLTVCNNCHKMIHGIT